jgi:hypothetical protein
MKSEGAREFMARNEAKMSNYFMINFVPTRGLKAPPQIETAL